jgi:glyoxylase-like metal-dependent hydrolase (beta-lactamase superfamily II)
VIDLPGHTPGSIGLAVTTDDGVAVLTGDAVATADSLRSGRCLGRPLDARQADASVARVAGLADFVYPGHDRPFRVTGRVAGDYLGDPVPITFRVPDPAIIRYG